MATDSGFRLLLRSVQNLLGAVAVEPQRQVDRLVAQLVHDLMEARDERRLRMLQKHLASVKLLILDELGYLPFTGLPPEKWSFLQYGF